jgi:FixJ family two-component response regulator
VPVPEEHVEEAMAMILRMTARARLKEWDQEAFSELFHRLDEPTKSVLSAVARAMLAKKTIDDLAVAESIEFTRREVLGIARELNEEATTLGYPAVLMIRQEVETLPNGRTREQRLFSMTTEMAILVREAEQEELRAAPHPLLSDQG